MLVPLEKYLIRTNQVRPKKAAPLSLGQIDAVRESTEMEALPF